jgi:rhomboid protease GluP
MNWDKLFDALGLNSTAWQWRRLRWQRRWEEMTLGWRRRKEQVTYRHKMCRQCGALIDRADTVCGRCGAVASSWKSQAFGRLLGLVLPGHCPVTYLLIGLIFVNLLIVMVLFGGRQLLLPEPIVLVRMGALVPYLALELGEYWRMVTYGYLHVGLMHIAFNAIALSQAGSVLEREIGGARFFVVYTVALVGGAAADLVARGPVMVPIAGASGALFGLIGFGISYAHFYGGPQGRQLRNFFFHWAVYGFLFGYLVRADNIAHLGGFLPGLVLGFLLERERRWGAKPDPMWNTLAALCVGLTATCFGWLMLGPSAVEVGR